MRYQINDSEIYILNVSFIIIIEMGKKNSIHTCMSY